MKAYRYNADRYFAGEIECQIDPLSSKSGSFVWLLPANSTWAEPLPEKEGFKIKFNGTSWVYEAIPEPEPEPELTEEELNAREIAELLGKLAASDYAVIKIAEGAAKREEYAELITQRQEWRARLNELGV